MRPIRRIAVIGAGTIGASWAAWFLSRGLEVVASDPSPGAPELIRRMVEGAWPILQQLGAVEGADPGRWSFEPDPVKAVTGCDAVQESAPERYEVKQPLLRAISAAMPADALILCSSSGLLVSRLSEGCTHPERVVIGHPFNPPHLIPLVEVMGNARTAPEAVTGAEAFYRAVGKVTIRLNKEKNGHVANRLQAALWREAISLVVEGVASVEDVDKAVWAGPGLRWAAMGPTMLFNLGAGAGGLRAFCDHFSDTFNGWWDDLGQVQLTPEVAEILIRGVNDEARGDSPAALSARRDALILAMQKATAGLRQDG